MARTDVNIIKGNNSPQHVLDAEIGTIFIRVGANDGRMFWIKQYAGKSGWSEYVSGGGGSSGAIPGSYSYGELRDLDANDGDIANCYGRESAGDGGEGLFVKGDWGADDDGTIVGNWKRIYDGDVYLEWFGGKADGVLSDTADGYGGYTTNGSTLVGLSNYLFTDDDIGKVVRVDECGVAGKALVGHIVSVPVQSGAYCNIDVASSVTQSATKIMFVGTDNSDAMDAALAVAGSSVSNIGAGRILLKSGTYCFSRKIDVASNVSVSIVGVHGDVRNQFTRIAVCHEDEGLYIHQSATDAARSNFSGFEIWSHATAAGCLRSARTNATISHFRTEFGLYGLHVDNSFSSIYMNFYCRRATSHGIYLDGTSNKCNHNTFLSFQSDVNGGCGIYAEYGAINEFKGECNNNTLFPFRFKQQQSSWFHGYCETTTSGKTFQLGYIEDDCIDCRDDSWAGSLRTTVDNGMGSKTRDCQGVSLAKSSYAAGKITNLQPDSEFIGGVGGFAYTATQGGVITAGLGTVTQDTTKGFLSGSSLKIATDPAVTGTPTVVLAATRSLGHTLALGETVIIRGWVRASREMFYNNDPTQAYFQVNVATDGLAIGDNAQTFYADSTAWRPFVSAFRMYQAAATNYVFNLQIANAKGTGGNPDTVWITGLELYVLPATNALTDSAERGKDWARSAPYVRTFANATQAANIGVFGGAPTVATADLPAADANMNNTILIEDTGATLNLVLYGAGRRVIK